MMAAALTSVAYLSARPAAGGSPNPLTHSPGLWGEPYNLLAPGTKRGGAPPCPFLAFGPFSPLQT